MRWHEGSAIHAGREGEPSARPGRSRFAGTPEKGDAAGALNGRRKWPTLANMDGAAEEGVRLSDDGGLLTLPEHMDIRTAPLVHEAMCTALRTAAGLHIEGHTVLRVDGAGLQLLCALFLTAGPVAATSPSAGARRRRP
jgi:hypothetical protein